MGPENSSDPLGLNRGAGRRLFLALAGPLWICFFLRGGAEGRLVRLFFMHADLTQFYRGKRVLVTGHTGFKGSWLCEWLLMLGADVTGFSLAPDTAPALFEQIALAGRMDHRLGDIREGEGLAAVVTACQPDVVFHLAAQPIVRLSYRDPVATFDANVMGTARLLDALRSYPRPCSVVIVTSDKCYENVGTFDGYAEDAPLGGHDPYSASKACAELVTHSFRRSFFSGQDSPVRIASARAGNVIGGGDWAPDRIVPDCIRSLETGNPIAVRNKRAVRPWQHVVEPLRGYLALAAAIHPEQGGISGIDRSAFDAFNFGPDPEAHRTVEDLVEEVLVHWKGEWVDQSDPSAPHEAAILTLSVEKAAHLLDWRPAWSFSETIARTVAWYRAGREASPESLAAFTQRQIAEYMKAVDAPRTLSSSVFTV
jgi:CDP-glucose 4,6-dehydratase